MAIGFASKAMKWNTREREYNPLPFWEDSQASIAKVRHKGRQKEERAQDVFSLGNPDHGFDAQRVNSKENRSGNCRYQSGFRRDTLAGGFLSVQMSWRIEQRAQNKSTLAQ